MKSSLITKVDLLLKKKYGIPNRETPLPDALNTLIATILSQNTNDNNSYLAFVNLKKAFPNWSIAADAPKSKIALLIRSAGLTNQKADAIKTLLANLKKRGAFNLDYLLEFNNNEIIAELTKQKGIGVKTASCVLLFSMDRNVCPVDTHVNRTVNRIGIVNEKIPDKTFFALNKNFPEKIAHSFHTNLIKLGREICVPTNPKCGSCPLKQICKYEMKNLESRNTKVRKQFLLLDNINVGK